MRATAALSLTLVFFQRGILQSHVSGQVSAPWEQAGDVAGSHFQCTNFHEPLLQLMPCCPSLCVGYLNHESLWAEGVSTVWFVHAAR